MGSNPDRRIWIAKSVCEMPWRTLTQNVFQFVDDLVQTTAQRIEICHTVIRVISVLPG
jgi:hypothetical protein